VSLWQSFQNGGWVMYFIFAFGLTGVGAAGRFAWRGEHQLVGFIRWLAVTVLASGAFGFAVGAQMFLGAAAGEVAAEDVAGLARRAWVLLIGTREALSCVSGALMFFVIITLLTAVGFRRFPLPNPGAAAR
jgi:hypothetical protein